MKDTKQIILDLLQKTDPLTPEEIYYIVAHLDDHPDIKAQLEDDVREFKAFLQGQAPRHGDLK